MAVTSTGIANDIFGSSQYWTDLMTLLFNACRSAVELAIDVWAEPRTNGASAGTVR